MKERRYTILNDSKPSVRIEKEGEKSYFSGYAAVFNQRSKLIFEGGRMFNEILKPGCFDKVLEREDLDVILTLDHEHFYNLGRSISGNLVLSTDEIGLKFRAPVPNTTLGRDTEEMISRGDYTDCSFSFQVEESGETWERDGDGNLLHIVNEVSALYDATICTLRGAYGETIINVERAERMFKELDCKDRNEPDGEKSDAEKEAEKKAAESSTGKPDEKDQKTDAEKLQEKKDLQEKEDIATENDLDQMILDVHKAKS